MPRWQSVPSRTPCLTAFLGKGPAPSGHPLKRQRLDPFLESGVRLTAAPCMETGDITPYTPGQHRVEVRSMRTMEGGMHPTPFLLFIQ